MADNVVLEAKNVTRVFGTGEAATIAVNDVSLQMNKGELVVLLGASGSGKSTLLALLSGLLRPTSGTAMLLGVDIWSLNERQRREFRWNYLGFIFQGFNLFSSLTALGQLELVLRWGGGVPYAEAHRRAKEMLQSLGLERRQNSLPDELSGGEKQRVAIGRALIKKPSFCFADEPTSALDWERGKSVIELLRNAARQQGTMTLLVTHDTRILPFADRVIRMEDGRISEG